MLTQTNSNPTATPTSRPLSQEQIAQYHEDGFIIVPGFFDPEEVEPLRKAYEKDPNICGMQSTMIDAAGQANKLVAWTDLGNSLLGVFPRIARIVDAAEALQGTECYHWHSKLATKEPHSKGNIEWHQGYGAWYDDGCLYPQLVTCGVAIDKNYKENGCLEVIKKSHLLGRLDHVTLGGTHATEPVRLKQVMERLELVYCEMEPGDALFFHANTLHGSGPNQTDQPRTLMHCTYNAVSNQPLVAEGQEHHLYQPLEKLPDSIIKDGGYTSVFDNQEFHPPETEDGAGYGIFRRG